MAAQTPYEKMTEIHRIANKWWRGNGGLASDTLDEISAIIGQGNKPFNYEDVDDHE